ncbi:MAG: hypothetical protein ACOC35_09545 [Promethearchaeia archaeon]
MLLDEMISKKKTNKKFTENLDGILSKKKGKEIQDLAEKCLKFKWIKEKKKNLNRLLSPCSFCFEVKANAEECSNCKIPKILCDKDGQEGFIGFLAQKYGNIFLKDMSDKEYKLLRQSLMELKTSGQIRLSTKKNLEKKGNDL